MEPLCLWDEKDVIQPWSSVSVILATEGGCKQAKCIIHDVMCSSSSILYNLSCGLLPEFSFLSIKYILVSQLGPLSSNSSFACIRFQFPSCGFPEIPINITIFFYCEWGHLIGSQPRGRGLRGDIIDDITFFTYIVSALNSQTDRQTHIFWTTARQQD